MAFVGAMKVGLDLHFFGEVRVKFRNSCEDPIGVGILAISGDRSRESWLSSDLLGEPQAVTGEGRGVISSTGPKPGEDTAEAGEREPPVKCAAEREDLTLELLCGRGDANIGCWIWGSTGFEDASERLGSWDLAKMSVCNRKPTLEGLWTCTESLVGCACGAAVSIE